MPLLPIFSVSSKGFKLHAQYVCLVVLWVDSENTHSGERITVQLVYSFISPKTQICFHLYVVEHYVVNPMKLKRRPAATVIFPRTVSVIS